MKKFFSVVCAVSMMAAVAKADILAAWTFETSVPITAGPHAAEGGLVGGDATGFHASGAAVYSNPVGNGSFESFSSNTWAIGDYYQFETSTAGYQDIAITWAQTRSSTGPAIFDLEYSTDGVTFTTLVDDYTVGQITWSSGLFDPASVFGPAAGPSDLNDQASIFFRLTAASAPSGAAGTNRVDDIIITGNLIPEPASLGLLVVGALFAARRRR